MSIKTIAYAIGRGITKLILLSSLLLGSCAGLGLAHNKSAFWSLDQIDTETAARTSKFFVAFVEENAEGDRKMFALPYSIALENREEAKRVFRLRDGKISLDVLNGDNSITVWSETAADNTQTTRVHVVGDSPWVSVSEYQVKNEVITPRRFGHGRSGILIAALIVPILLVYFCQTPVRRIAEWLFPNKKSPSRNELNQKS